MVESNKKQKPYNHSPYPVIVIWIVQFYEMLFSLKEVTKRLQQLVLITKHHNKK